MTNRIFWGAAIDELIDTYPYVVCTPVIVGSAWVTWQILTFYRPGDEADTTWLEVPTQQGTRPLLVQLFAENELVRALADN